MMMGEVMKSEPASGADAEIDLYDDAELDQFADNDLVKADDDAPTNGADDAASGNDLFDAVLTEAARPASRDSQANLSVSSANSSSAVIKQESSRRYCCYVGNMTWWTTDQDLTDAIAGIGVADLVDIKFYENRNNGQSKGFALVVFASDASVRACMEKLPTHTLHAQQLVVLPYTKQSLAQFEQATRRPSDARNDKKPAAGVMSKEVSAVVAADPKTIYLGTVHLSQTVARPPPVSLQGAPMPPPLSLVRPSPPPSLMRAPPLGFPPQPLLLHSAPPRLPMQHHQRLLGPPHLPPPTTNQPPPGFLPPTSAPQPLMSRPTIPPPGAPPLGFPPPGAHINPNVYPGAAGMMGAVGGGGGHDGAPLSESEFEEIMSRNRTVSSSAISRAVSDAAAGDYPSAIETLVTAISLIRQSRVAHDDRCRVLITSLQDTLHGIEAKSYARRTKERGRDRSRSPDRARKRHRRSRSRSRSRERYDYSPRTHRRYWCVVGALTPRSLALVAESSLLGWSPRQRAACSLPCSALAVRLRCYSLFLAVAPRCLFPVCVREECSFMCSVTCCTPNIGCVHGSHRIASKSPDFCGAARFVLSQTLALFIK